MASIGIDCRFAGTGTGLARYTTEITKALLHTPGSWTLFVRDATEPWIRTLPGSPRIIVAPYRHYSLGEHTRFPFLLRQSGIDLLFVPHFNAPAVCSVPVVVTVHDLILHRYPNTASLLKRFLYKRVFARALQRSRAIIAVSGFVANELADAYPSAAAKTTVITEGVGEAFHKLDAEAVARVKREYGIGGDYFLYVGNAKQHKNVQMLLDAFAASGVSDASLVLVTGGPEAKRLRLPPNVLNISGVDDPKLAALYSGARAFVTASLYEGFCLPVAEALACGCAVVATNRSAIPETLGTRGVLLEPTVDAFAAAFQNPPAPPVPVVTGDWDEAGRRTAEVLRSVIG